jgi:hypothetical protein
MVPSSRGGNFPSHKSPNRNDTSGQNDNKLPQSFKETTSGDDGSNGFIQPHVLEQEGDGNSISKMPIDEETASRVRTERNHRIRLKLTRLFHRHSARGKVVIRITFAVFFAAIAPADDL